MTYLITILIFLGCFALMAVGLLLTKKVLKRGCSLGDDCTCKNDPDPKTKEKCDLK